MWRGEWEAQPGSEQREAEKGPIPLTPVPQTRIIWRAVSFIGPFEGEWNAQALTEIEYNLPLGNGKPALGSKEDLCIGWKRNVGARDEVRLSNVQYGRIVLELSVSG